MKQIDIKGSCRACRFSHGRGTETLTIYDCRRYPPAVFFNAGFEYTETDWPHVKAEDVCGEFEHQEGEE